MKKKTTKKTTGKHYYQDDVTVKELTMEELTLRVEYYASH